MFPISRDPPEGGTVTVIPCQIRRLLFPISRDPPEGGTHYHLIHPQIGYSQFPISRDPPEGGTSRRGMG